MGSGCTVVEPAWLERALKRKIGDDSLDGINVEVIVRLFDRPEKARGEGLCPSYQISPFAKLLPLSPVIFLAHCVDLLAIKLSGVGGVPGSI
jgi:hypothetical protein